MTRKLALVEKQGGRTLTDWLPWWEVELQARGCRKATLVNRRKAIARLVRFTGDIAPARVSGELLAEWRDQLTAEGLMSSSVNMYLANARSLLGWLVDEGELSEVPSVRKAVGDSERPPATFDGKQLTALVKAAQDMSTRGKSRFECARNVALVSLLADSGLRASECAGLLLSDVDVSGMQAFVPAETAKTGRARTVVFGQQTARLLGRYLRERERHTFAWHERLFVGRRGPMSYESVWGVVKAAGKAAGVTARPHVFRHSWASNMKRAGASDEMLMSLGGWSTLEMVHRYGKADRDARAAEQYRQLGSPMDRATMGATNTGGRAR